MTFASADGATRINLQDKVFFVGEGAFKRAYLCEKYPLALKFTFKHGGSGKEWPTHCLKKTKVFEQASNCRDILVSYYGGVLLQGDCSRSLNGSSETPVTDVASVTIAERAAEIGETVARKQWLQPCSPTLLRLHAKMDLGMIRTLLQLFLRGFTPRLTTLAVRGHGYCRPEFSEASSLGSAGPDETWAFINLDPLQNTEEFHPNQPGGFQPLQDRS